MTRHEFLLELHEVLRPRGYLEIGVHTGDSLRLVHPGTPAIGIDPAPMVNRVLSQGTQVIKSTSDSFFDPFAGTDNALVPDPLDLVFIDGMHLYEYALRDFLNIERYVNHRSVVVFDDVLPRNQGEAAREQCPGDWTGDVWKVYGLLKAYRPGLNVQLVDTLPTGTLVVWGFDGNPEAWIKDYEQVMLMNLDQFNEVPDEILKRTDAIGANKMIKILIQDLEGA